MVKHIVVWKLFERAEGRTREDNARLAKQRLEALRGCVPGLRHLEVGLNIEPSEAAFDLALYSEFDDEAALAAYQEHPQHLAFKGFMKGVRDRRVVVDYRV